LVQRHTWQPIKGHLLHKSEKKATERMPHHKQFTSFSLQSVRIKILKTQKTSRTRRTIPQTLTFSRTKFNQIQAQCSEIHHGSQRFIKESSSPNHFLCNSSVNPPLKAANSTRSQRKKNREEEGKKFKGFEPEKKKKKLPVHFRIQTKNQQNRIKIQSS